MSKHVNRPLPGLLTRDALAESVAKGEIDTVLTVFPDMYGRLMGKRLTASFFLDHADSAGTHVCDYLLACDMEMDPVPGYRFASWEDGYGDMRAVPDLTTLRRVAWLPGSALALCDLFTEPGGVPAEPSPRRMLQRQLEQAAALGFRAMGGTELEFYAFNESYESAREKGYQSLKTAAAYIEDYHIFQTSREEDLMRAILQSSTYQRSSQPLPGNAQDRRFYSRYYPRRLMAEGVTIFRPETCVIDAEVEVGADTVIEPYVQLLGATRIGSDCRIRSYSVIQQSVLGDGVTVRNGCILDGAEVGDGAMLGPYAHLRPESKIGEQAHVGNFCETKKVTLGRGSKANHLTYLGDAVIGDGVNVGAGVITCNYDGVNKHTTTIGDGAFVGSDSTLVAPVSIGEGAYVGAGSCITHPVPAGALAIGRAQQITKEGWAARRRAARQAKKKS